jgi:tRNA-specific 2-thiouridylase
MSAPIAVAMSGGLDSSVAAWLLAAGDAPVLGLSMLLWDRSAESVHGRCCGALDLGDARRVARQCGIPHYTLRMQEEFRRHVVEPFVDDYLAGRTPVPCKRCNTWIKFDLFLDKASSLGAERIATGHYARLRHGDEGWELHAAAHSGKDQSYYLFELDQTQLARTLFPLGELSKEQVRETARRAGLLVAEKGESMELCFVSDGVREFVESEVAAAPGRFAAAAGATTVVDRHGRELGRAEPYYRYTIGQRRGLGVTSREPLYVLEIQPRQNRLVVGGADSLERAGLAGRGLHWIGPPPEGPIEATVRIRSRHAGVPSLLRAAAGDRVEVEFATPQRGVTPGQAAVFYDGTRVLGGCWIEKALE